MNYLNYVNVKQGTRSIARFSAGNTLPLTQLPFGFASFAPQTDGSRRGWFYHPEDHSIEGIRLTHQPSPWINEHGAIVMMPQTEVPYLQEGRRWSGFRPKETVLEPHYIKLNFLRSQALFELTPTTYGAAIRVTYNGTDKNYFSLLPVTGNTSYNFDPEKNILLCKTDCNVLRSCDKYPIKAYFAFRFKSGAINAENTLIEDNDGSRNGLKIEGSFAGIHLSVDVAQLDVEMATSFISEEQALRNLDNDNDYENFDALKERNFEIWNDYLGRIKIKAPENQMKTFYSCLYRTFLFPHKAYEPDENGNPVHYSPATGDVKCGVRYTDNGFWDTYRTIYPLFALIAPQEYPQMLEGFLNDYRDGGWLPCWTAGDAKHCMPSTAIDAVFADAAVKGIMTEEQMKTALEGMMHHAENASDVLGYGREGCLDYLKYGYVAYDEHKESVNLTLDAAYFDRCIADVANLLGEKEIADKYLKRSNNYKNIFDPETGFMRAKGKDGKFRQGFVPHSWGGDYTEASAWQTTFAVQHDFEGLAELFGGKEKFLAKLDAFFAEPPRYTVTGYKQEIHEITEMAALDIGQCAISNQPSFHIPFLYAYFGERKKTDDVIRLILEQSFTAEDDGFPGDEDNGTMAAWYIFVSLGFYPLTPGKADYVITTPLVESAEIMGKPVNLPSDRITVTFDELKNGI